MSPHAGSIVSELTVTYASSAREITLIWLQVLALATVLVVAIEPGAADAWEPLLWDHLKRRDGAKVRALCLGARPPDAYVAAKCKRLKQPYEALDVDAFLKAVQDASAAQRTNVLCSLEDHVGMISMMHR